MNETRHDTIQKTRAPIAALALMMVALSACAKHEAAPADSAKDSTSASAPASPAASAMPTDITPVRGTIASVSDSALTVTTAAGDVNIAVEPPLHVFERAKSDLAHVTPTSFIGVTSVKQADGSELAT